MIQLSLFLMIGSLFAQDVNTNFDGQERVILTHNSAIDGKEYLYGSWNKGFLVMNDSLFFAQNYLRYDAYNDRILVKSAGSENEAFQVNDPNLTGFSLIDEKTNKKHDFVKLQDKHFENHVTNGFFEVVFNVEKSNYLLKKTVVTIYDPNKSKGTLNYSNVQQEFKQKEYYYLKTPEGGYLKVNLKKKDILNVLNAHNQKMNTFIKENKISFSKEEQVAQLVNYYYSL